ncbi:MAG: hypothetical protein HQM06_14685 [Magnetococcales bacterium]|nr:hypothetical protein [Magnetococcales bacterium]
MATISELAEREKFDNSYVAKVMRLTLLAPDIVEMILDGITTESDDLAGVGEGVSGGVDGATAVVEYPATN